jgi:hypothetical protein
MKMTIENEELDESALFNEAVGDEPEVIPEPIAADEGQSDDRARASQEPEPEAELKADGEKPAVDDNAPQVPSWRVREINEEKRAAIAERDALLAERDNWKRQPVVEQKPAEKPAKPDPLLDPDGYEAYLEAKVEAKFLNDRRETSLALAHKTYTTEFEEAYAAAQKQIDPALKARMQQSRDPGETLIEWHREQKTRAEVGSDLNAYKQRLRDEALKDPEFLAKAVEAARDGAKPQSNGRPLIDLPPSLNGASRSNAALRAGTTDMSDEQLFAETTG